MVLKEIPFIGDYTLRYDWNGYEKMCEALGAETFGDFDLALGKLGPKTLRLILWAGFLHKFPNLKKEEVSGIIDQFGESNSKADMFPIVMNALKEAGLIADRGNDTGEAK
jgi:hypothetical protein